ncbi:sodium- and chloride-dependent neutral and basic amino acid transporter B(0+)-like [Thalassophryne amazonica]|uniref:sodium- and chloride-dependent neutral and basic amino acid transporter B(0+)-like n=1 Tax=Thalassophryne amazonica TaxID=390379 RepID=UPI001470F7A6|nr:sodium- and chloride-dependent neutral and basic amino acid transporter B(0+)-like [Thalassophryne amazonica]
MPELLTALYISGVGVGTVMVTAMVSVYYNVIIAYSLYYMFASFQSPLPWSNCLNWLTVTVECSLNETVANLTQINGTCPEESTSLSEQYWDNVVLQRSSGLDETGPIVWHLALCLLLSSILITAVLIRGIKSSGKVVYFTATFPYVVILILVIRGATLEGARDGIEYYIGVQSNLTKLTEAQVWKDAATQIFYSLSIAWGGLMTLASYNNFHNNVFKDTFVVTLTNAGTSLFAGFAIFSILGHMAHVYGNPVGEVVKEGFGLAFIAYPDALSNASHSPLWSILFFVMLITVGLDSQLQELFVGSWLPAILALLEVTGLCYIYGGNRFIKDIEMMLGTKTFCFWLWWKACWFFITPCIIAVILIWSLMELTPPVYGGSVPYPPWGLALGWCMVAFVLIWIPIFATWKLMTAEGQPWKRLKSVCCPSEDWHPYLAVHRGERYSEERCRHHKMKNIISPDSNNLNIISNSWL